MLTIGQVASYAGVTIRAVRHYHRIGLLPEPARDSSGYRSYDAVAVLRLVRIRTLAEAGVPLARVRELLGADPETFNAAKVEIDRRLRAQIRELQEHRRRIAELGPVDAVAVRPEVVEYLGLLRATGAPEEMVQRERDAWILVAARWPDSIPALMAVKTAQLDDPDTVALYRLIGQVAEDPDDEDLLREVADHMSRMYEAAEARGELQEQNDIMPRDPEFDRLMDTFAENSHPVIGRLRAMIAERGWSGWTRAERDGS